MNRNVRIGKPAHDCLLFLLLLSMILAGCAPSAPASTASQAPASTPTSAAEAVTSLDQVVGIWHSYNDHCDGGYTLIRPDGTYTLSCSQDGSNGASGKYTLQNGTFTFENDVCSGGQYLARLMPASSGPRSLILTVVKDDCPGEVDFMTKLPLVWVGPLP